MTHSHDLLGQPPATMLADTPGAREALERGDDPAQVAAAFPAYPGAWAALADRAFADGSVVESYAYARTGYHRALDALRRAGWKGHGPVPWSHVPNQGYLRCVNALARAAGAIGERDEATRCQQLLHDSDPAAAGELA
jgi:Protein of unknown function (DUF3151)